MGAQDRRLGYGGGAFGFVRVTVVALGASHARTLDDNGNEYDVPLALRMGRSGYPQVGDKWIITKVAGHWCFSAIIGPKKPPVITAPRDGADRLTIQILNALLEHGLVTEEGRSEGRNGGADLD